MTFNETYAWTVYFRWETNFLAWKAAIDERNYNAMQFYYNALNVCYKQLEEIAETIKF